MKRRLTIILLGALLGATIAFALLGAGPSAAPPVVPPVDIWAGKTTPPVIFRDDS